MDCTSRYCTAALSKPHSKNADLSLSKRSVALVCRGTSVGVKVHPAEALQTSPKLTTQLSTAGISWLSGILMTAQCRCPRPPDARQSSHMLQLLAPRREVKQIYRLVAHATLPCTLAMTKPCSWLLLSHGALWPTWSGLHRVREVPAEGPEDGPDAVPPHVSQASQAVQLLGHADVALQEVLRPCTRHPHMWTPCLTHALDQARSCPACMLFPSQSHFRYGRFI